MTKESIPKEDCIYMVSGQIFTYYGPRVPPLFKRNLGFGCIISSDIENGIVFIRTYKADDKNNPKIDIGFMPILFSAFKKSLKSIEHEYIDVEDAKSALEHWKEEYSNDIAGCFKDEIYKAEELAWETVASNSEKIKPETHGIEYAYPYRENSGEYTSVRVSVYVLPVAS